MGLIDKAKEKFLMGYIHQQASIAGFGEMMGKLRQVQNLSEGANREVDIDKALSMVASARSILDELAKEYPEQAYGLKKGYATLDEQARVLRKLKPQRGAL